MALLDLWNANKDAVASLKIEQVLATAGDGNLRDDSGCASELRKYLGLIPLKTLAEYAERCLTNPFTSSGLVLQDIVNEIGRRLDYEVTNGRYQGIKGQVGCDGIWCSPEGQSIVVEVKTTDAYRIKLETIAGYQKALLTQGKLTHPPSILIIVGRNDTGELEAQVRGSRHAWDIRLISVDALLKLARLKQETDDPETAEKIRALLIPIDYTRLDDIIDVMFTTAKDLGEAGEEALSDQAPSTPLTTEEGAPSAGLAAINLKREQLIKTMSTNLTTALLKKSRATYWDSSHETRVVCSISKAYADSVYRYWYAYHPSWDAFLAEGKHSYVIWGGVDLNIAFVMPRGELLSKLPQMTTTTPPNGKQYWHVKILERSSGNYFLQLPHAARDLPLAPFQVDIPLI